MVETLSDTQVAPQTDGAFILSAPAALPGLPPIAGNPLRLASGETVAPLAIPAARPKPLARRRPLTVLFDLAVVGLIVACVAVCVYRLFWAMQP